VCVCVCVCVRECVCLFVCGVVGILQEVRAMCALQFHTLSLAVS